MNHQARTTPNPSHRLTLATLTLTALLFSALPTAAHADTAQWRITTYKDSGKLVGLEYNKQVEGLDHQFFMLLDPSNKELNKVAFMVMQPPKFSTPPFNLGGIALVTEKGEHMIVSIHSQKMRNFRKYSSCIQRVEGITFDKAFMKKMRGLMRKMAPKPVVQTAAGIVALKSDPDFLKIQSEILAQVKRLQPVALAAEKAFSFASCEKGDTLMGILKKSKEFRKLDLDDAELREHDEGEDLVSPFYTNPYMAWASPKMKKTKLKKDEYIFETDAMGAAGPISSITNEVTYKGRQSVKLADSTSIKNVEVDVFDAEMKIPLVSWFMNIVITYKVDTAKSGRSVVLTEYFIPGADSQIMTWPLR
ncbi:hypothetical protein KAI87_06665 [Myxococcota bacterium]|nr:hypothetical protein [Myxococcota bacterium]